MMFGSKNKIESAFNLNTRQADQALEKFKGKLGGLGALKGPAMAAGAIAGVGAAAAAATVQMAKAAANFELQSNKIGTVFGEQIGTIDRWADSVRMSMGMSSHEAKLLAANFQDLLIPMGFTRKEATGMTMDVVGLSAALSEWSGGTRTAAEVSSILSKAMLGEREQLKTLGISIMEKDVVQRVATMGMKDATGAARQQARAMATQQLIFERSTDAQAAFASGTDSMFRTQQALASQISEMKNIFVANLHEPMKELSIIIANDVMPALEGMGNFMANTLPEMMRKTAAGVRNTRNAFLMLTDPQGFQELGAQERLDTGQAFVELNETMLKTVPIVGELNGWIERLGGPDVIGKLTDTTKELTAAQMEEEIAKEKLVKQSQNLELAMLEIYEAATQADEAFFRMRDNIPPIIEDNLEMYASISQAAAGAAEEVRASASQALEGRKFFEKEMMLATIRGDSDRLEFLKKNQHEIMEQVRQQTKELQESYQFDPSILDSIDIADMLTEQLWDTHLLGVKSALEKEEELAAKRADEEAEKIRQQIRNNTMLAQAGVVGQMFNKEAQLVDTPTYGRAESIAKFGIGFGGTTAEIIDGKRTGREVSAFNQRFTAEEARALTFQRNGETVNVFNFDVDAGIWTHDEAELGNAIAQAINKAAAASGAKIKSDAVEAAS